MATAALPDYDHSVTVALSIEIEEKDLNDLRKRADLLGMNIEDLARATILDLIRMPDADFETAATRVLDKNAELYRRLG